ASLLLRWRSGRLVTHCTRRLTRYRTVPLASPVTPVDVAPGQRVGDEPELHLLPPWAARGGFVVGAEPGGTPQKGLHLFGRGWRGPKGDQNDEQQGERLRDRADIKPVELRAAGPHHEGEHNLDEQAAAEASDGSR